MISRIGLCWRGFARRKLTSAHRPLLTVLGVLFAAFSLHAGETDMPPKLRIIVPAYFYPSGKGIGIWDSLIEAAARIPVIAIVNPASGPGERVDPNYTAVIEKAKRGGVGLVGYVNTDYARRPQSDVEAEVVRWLEFYPTIGGIFFDCQPSGAEHVETFVSLRNFVRERIPKAHIITNPGTRCAEEYFARSAADTVCIFEHHEGFDRFEPPAWVAAYASQRFYVLPYATPDVGTMKERIRASVRQGVGNVYVTDAAGRNPWNRLPSYWNEEVNMVEEINRAESQ